MGFLVPQPLHKGFIQCQAMTQDFTRLPKSGLMKGGRNGMMMDPYPYPQHMKVVKYLSYVWTGCGNHSMWVWSVNHSAQGLHSTPTNDPGFQPTSQIWANKCGGSCMMMDPYPHPQHMKVIKHLSYVWRGFGNHSMWVWSLNQCTITIYSANQ